MKCPYCGDEESKVIDSRPTEDGERIRRRRECLRCHMRFTTYEVVETVPLIVIKKDNSREPLRSAEAPQCHASRLCQAPRQLRNAGAGRQQHRADPYEFL